MAEITLEQRAATVPPTTAVTFVPAFSEAARMLGFAKATGSEDGAAYWGAIVAEYEAAAKAALRLPAGADWQPIETAPKSMNAAVMLGNEHGCWVGTYRPLYVSGFRPDCPWQSLMLNHEHLRDAGGVLQHAPPTHWQPLPAAPRHETGEG